MNRIMMNRPVFKHIPRAHTHMHKQSCMQKHIGTNILLTENGFEIQLAVPGIDKNHLDIAVQDNILKISSRMERDVENKEYKLKQFDYRNFSKSFELSEDIDRELIEAKYNDGILFIQLSKKEKNGEENMRKIEIK